MGCKKIGLIISSCLYLTLNSQVTQEEVIDRLYHTCKVWGYFKYHHNNVTRYNTNYPPVDWDDALLASLNGIIVAKDHPSFHDSLNVLLYKAGALNEYIDYWGYRGDSIHYKDFSWHNDGYLSQNVRDTLSKIRKLFKNEVIGYFYVNERAGYPFIKFDNKYHMDTTVNLQMRLLTLFRYWNLVEYTYQHKHLLTPNWNMRLKLVLKEILDVKTQSEFIFVIKKLTKSLNDSRGHFRHPIYDSFIGTNYAPFKLRFLEGKTIIVNKPDSIREINIGDEVTYIEEEPIQSVREYYRTFAEGANEAAIERNVDEMICRGNSYASFKIKKANGQSVLYSFLRSKENIIYFQNIPDTKSLYDTTVSDGCSFGILDFRKITSNDITTETLETIWFKDAWIFDLRGTPVVWFEQFLIRYIYNDYKEYYFFREPNLQIPGEFYSQKRYNGDYNKYKTPRYTKKIILLVDEYTQKNSEYIALCLKEREDVMVIGSTTDGAGALSLAQVYLPFGIYTNYTYSGAQNKAKKPYYKIGVPLDTFVRPTIEDIRLRRDIVLEAALKCTNTKLGISQVHGMISFQIYPNPFMDNLVIENPYNKTQDYFIFNILGQQVGLGKLTNGKNLLNLDYLSKGFYHIRIENSSFKLSKE